MQQTPYDESKEGVIRAPDYVPQLHVLPLQLPEKDMDKNPLRSAGIIPLTPISRSSPWVQSRVAGHQFVFVAYKFFFSFISQLHSEALWQDLRLCS